MLTRTQLYSGGRGRPRDTSSCQTAALVATSRAQPPGCGGYVAQPLLVAPRGGRVGLGRRAHYALRHCKVCVAWCVVGRVFTFVG